MTAPPPDTAVRLTVRAAARAHKPLDGADAQALEGALQQVERELGEAAELLRLFMRADDGAPLTDETRAWLTRYDERTRKGTAK